jgi:hypothetical protein
MQVDVADKLPEVTRIVRDADPVFADAEVENLRVWCAKHIPVSGAGGVVAVVMSDGDEPG